MRNTTILYQGGSAGFFLYYYLLLGGKYQTPDNLPALIGTQFPRSLITNRNMWKESEHWPANDLSIQCDKPNLFLVCNPVYGNLEWHQNLAQGTDIILLYTDLHTQLRMAYDKKAYWFTDQSKHDGKVPSEIRAIISSGVQWRARLSDPALPVIDAAFPVTRYVDLCEFLGERGNSAQQEFKEHWFSLQSPRAQYLLCK